MTKNELWRERQLEKARSKIVKAEIARSKREEQLKQNFATILDVMSLIALALVLFLAFFVDGFGFYSIPVPVYIISGGYLSIYAYLVYRRLTK